MCVLFAVMHLVLAQEGSRLSDAEFKILARQWLGETIVEPARLCVRRGVDTAEFRVRINRYGQVAIVFRTASSERVRKCVEFMAQPHQRFSGDIQTAEIAVKLPEEEVPAGRIVDDVPLREPKDSGGKCKSHADCGAGQVCLEIEATDLDEPSTGGRRCLDLQRWLVAQSTKLVEKP